MTKNYLSQLNEARTAAKGSILLVGKDEMLQHSRAMLFSVFKIPVETARGDAQVCTLPLSANFCLIALDLATLQSEMATLAAYIRRRWPAAKVLLLGRLSEDLDDPLYDDIVDPRFNPSGVIEVTKRLLKDMRPDLTEIGDTRVEE